MTTVSIRYIANDVDAAVEFYTALLGFELEMRPAPGFAALKRGSLRPMLNGAALPDGTAPQPGGWNRFQIELVDPESTVEELENRGASFRGEIVEGKGGRQILLDDPDGNPIELFEPKR